MTEDFRKRGLIENERLEEYDGTTAVIRNEYLSADEVEYLRWRAERGMKSRHLPAAFRHDPWFVMRNVSKMVAYTYRGCTLRTVLGIGKPTPSLFPLQLRAEFLASQLLQDDIGGFSEVCFLFHIPCLRTSNLTGIKLSQDDFLLVIGLKPCSELRQRADIPPSTQSFDQKYVCFEPSSHDVDTHISAPISAGTLNVVCVKKSMRTMPAIAAGSAVMMMNGSSHDWKFTTISMYTRTMANPSPAISPT
jgi:hypothetical protein